MKNFALIGASGYIAPRHMRAIKDTGNQMIAALDPYDGIGVLDSHFPEASFFTEFERFDRFVDKWHRDSGNKIEYMSKGKMKPRVIIRTSIGPKTPLDGGPQHTADYTESFKAMLTNTKVVSLNEPEEIFPAYEEALLGNEYHSTLIIENGGHYNDK